MEGKPHTCRCGQRWGGSKTAHCSNCHETFSTVSNFDRHLRTGLDGLVFHLQRGVWMMPGRDET